MNKHTKEQSNGQNVLQTKTNNIASRNFLIKINTV